MRIGWVLSCAAMESLHWVGPALSCDDLDGECRLEGWRWHGSFGSIMIDGSSTCDSGLVNIRLYDDGGDDPVFLGVATGFIEGHALQAIASGIETPESMAIKYSIEASGY